MYVHYVCIVHMYNIFDDDILYVYIHIYSCNLIKEVPCKFYILEGELFSYLLGEVSTQSFLAPHTEAFQLRQLVQILSHTNRQE